MSEHKMSKYIKAMILAGIMNPLTVSCTQVSRDGVDPHGDASAQSIKNQLELAKQEQRVDSVRRKLQDLPKEGTFKGLKVEYDKLQPQDIGHIFESGMNPIAMDSKSIESASFLGYYQMELRKGGLMSKFVSRYGHKYPELKGKNLKSQSFFNAYKAYATGDKAEAFHADMFELNYNVVYKGIFEELARKIPEIPEVTKDNCAEPELLAWAGAVMSCANQNPSKTAGIFEQAYKNMREKYGAMDIARSPDIKQAFISSVVAESYAIRQRKWGLKTRYQEERKLADESSRYLLSKRRYDEEVAKLKDCYAKAQFKPQGIPIPEGKQALLKIAVSKMLQNKKRGGNG